MKDDYNKFFKNEINLEKSNSVLISLIKKCNLKEILWIIRNISYDMVYYYDEENKGKIYDGSYNDRQREQVCWFQRQLSTYCDLFGQSIINKREFDEDYLNDNYKIDYIKSKYNSLEHKYNELFKYMNNK